MTSKADRDKSLEDAIKTTAQSMKPPPPRSTTAAQRKDSLDKAIDQTAKDVTKDK